MAFDCCNSGGFPLFFGCPGYGKRRAGKDGLFDHRCKKYRYRDSTDVHMYAVYCKTEKKLCLEHK